MTELFQIEGVPTADKLLGDVPSIEQMLPNLKTLNELESLAEEAKGRGG